MCSSSAAKETRLYMQSLKIGAVRRGPLLVGFSLVTKLEKWRKHRGVSQDKLAAAIGVSRTTYQRLERGDDDNPRLRYYVNASLALGCELEDLLEDEWLAWKVFDRQYPQPPAPETFWTRRDG